MADGDDLIAGADTEGEEREMQRRRTTRDGARIRRTDGRGEFTLEGCDLRTLCDPS
jgi:hypothetical protein